MKRNRLLNFIIAILVVFNISSCYRNVESHFSHGPKLDLKLNHDSTFEYLLIYTRMDTGFWNYSYGKYLNKDKKNIELNSNYFNGKDLPIEVIENNNLQKTDSIRIQFRTKINEDFGEFLKTIIYFDTISLSFKNTKIDTTIKRMEFHNIKTRIVWVDTNIIPKPEIREMHSIPYSVRDYYLTDLKINFPIYLNQFFYKELKHENIEIKKNHYVIKNNIKVEKSE